MLVVSAQYLVVKQPVPPSLSAQVRVIVTFSFVHTPGVWDEPPDVAVAVVVGATGSKVQHTLFPLSVNKLVLVASITVPVLVESLTSM